MAKKVQDHRSSLKVKNDELRRYLATREATLRDARIIKEVKLKTMNKDSKREFKSLSDEQINIICGRHSRMEGDPTAEKSPVNEAAKAATKEAKASED